MSQCFKPGLKMFDLMRPTKCTSMSFEWFADPAKCLDVLLMNPAAIRDYVSAAITHLLHALHSHGAGNRPEHALKIRAHHAFVLGIYGGSIHLVRLSICTCNNASRMLLLYRRFVFE